jgi:hypothetical protein
MPAKPVTTFVTEDGRILPTVELSTWYSTATQPNDDTPVVQLTVELPSRGQIYVWVDRTVARQLPLERGYGLVRFAFLTPTPGSRILELREIILPDGQIALCFDREADICLPD